jgi:NAD(P)-dependent dehydrogenase (short-subunit alcohol dehydrogenase family)
MALFSLAGQVAFITGAGSGIGQAIAIGLAEVGVDSMLFDLESSQGLADTRRAIETLGQRSLEHRGSVTDPIVLAQAVERCEDELGSLTLGVHSAGIGDQTAAAEMTLSNWSQMIDVNLTGIFLSCQAVGRAMLRTGKGSIVNISSISGLIVNRGITQAHYCAAKAGVSQLSKALALEWATRGIRVNTLSPGYVLTPMNMRPELSEHMSQAQLATPLQRLASPDEMIGPAIFLLSRASSFVTGINLLVDGGVTSW